MMHLSEQEIVQRGQETHTDEYRTLFITQAQAENTQEMQGQAT